MIVTQIDKIHQFDELKTAWEKVYSADPHAHIFVSWMWLRNWIKTTSYSWFILAVQPNSTSPYVAFLPLMMPTRGIYKFRPVRVLYMGGRPFAGYTGMICLPEYEEAVLAALGQYIQEQLGWDRFQLENILDPRIDGFLKKHFSYRKFNVQLIQRYKRDSCVFIPSLPETWEQYIQDFIGARTRRNMRRSFKEVKAQNLHISQIQNSTMERDIEALLTLWQRRWGSTAQIRWRAQWYRDIMRYYFENNYLWLGVLWDGTTPISALSGIIDRQKGVFYASLTGSSIDKYASLSPGKVVFWRSLQYAIENGFQTYDFMAGDEDYKFSFGATKRSLSHAIITPKNLRGIIANNGIKLARQVRGYLKKEQ